MSFLIFSSKTRGTLFSYGICQYVTMRYETKNSVCSNGPEQIIWNEVSTSWKIGQV